MVFLTSLRQSYAKAMQLLLKFFYDGGWCNAECFGDFKDGGDGWLAFAAFE